ncbi:MAG: DNA cytosine methyltransferase, partial [Actinobacteria bacterium]|nr:DNA cytosine methyltransferase [Actinomycetota bacterium]
NREWPVIDRNIHDVPSDEILATAGLREGDAHLLIGGPPCQPFSKSGYWASGDARRLDDPRASTLEAYLRVLRDTQPKAFLLENVAGLAYRNKDEGLVLLRTTIESINRAVGTSYAMSVALLKASEFGVPQDRERVFIIGQRDGLEFRFPTPTHSPDRLLGTEPVRTAWDAIGGLEDDDDPELRMTGKWADLLPSIPEGQNYLHHTDRGDGLPLFGWRRRYWSFLLKLSKSLPAWTITAQPGSAIGPFHWRNRRLSMRELARL